jgi:hypothetical protein
MSKTTTKSRHCSHCNHNVIDFTRSTEAQFIQQYTHKNHALCGRFLTEANGQIVFRKSSTMVRLQRIFLLALLLQFHQVLISRDDLGHFGAWKSRMEQRFASKKNVLTFYGIVKAGRERIDSVAVKITVNQAFTIQTTTDHRGRFTFELASNLLVDTLAFKVGRRAELTYAVNELAEEASKRIYKATYRRRYVSNGCPAF